MGLARCFRDSASETPAWHLLFRREIYLGRQSSYALDSDLIRRIRRHLLRRTLLHILARFPRHRVHLYTDTERLTDQYDRLGAAKFSTLPIPVNPQLRPRSELRRTVPRVVTYLGDARSEKGYHLLPSVLGALLPELEAGAIHFVVQSNVAFGDQPMDQRVVEARERLRRLSPRFVTLHEEALDSFAYSELLLAADVVLLPYDAERYYARSSGVLIEALSAGIPVLVPATSWMSDLLQPETTRYHDALLGVGDSRRIELEQEWRTEHGQAVEERGNGLIVAGGVSALRSYVRPRPSDGYLLVQVDLLFDLPPGTYLQVAARFVGGAGRTLSTDQRVLAATIEAQISALFAVPPQTERVELMLSGTFEADLIVLARPRLHVLGSRNRVSLEALGRAYVFPKEIPDAIRELLSAFETYREHATRFSSRTRLSDSAALLVSHLTMRPTEGKHRVVETMRTAGPLRTRDRF